MKPTSAASPGPEVLETLESVQRQGWREVEVLSKRGRSRGLRATGRERTLSLRRESGWAVRAGGPSRSFFLAATGTPRPRDSWPSGHRPAIRLPSARPIPAWRPPPDLEDPLLGETEASALLDALARELDNELAGARLLQAILEDGASETHLASSREVRGVLRQRSATLYLEASGAGRSRANISLLAIERSGRRLPLKALARRLADRLMIAERGKPVASPATEMLLAPPVVTAILGLFGHLWIGPGEGLEDLTLRGGRVGSAAFHLVDDGRLAAGLLAAAIDGEGMPTREVTLVEEGIFRQPLLTWWQTPTAPRLASGCALRPSWRQPPAAGATHLYLRPDPAVAAASLVGGLDRGYYLLDVEGGPRIDPGGHFALPVSGFSMDGGRAVGAVSQSWLVGHLADFTHGLVAVAKDLTFRAAGSGLLGAPTSLVNGLRLVRSRTAD